MFCPRCLRPTVLKQTGVALAAFAAFVCLYMPNSVRARPLTHPASAALRAFAEDAQQRLPAKAFRPFAALLNTKAPPAKTPGVFVTTEATKNMSCSGGVCTPTAARANLNVGELTRRLADGSVTIGTTAQAQNIYIDAPFSWTSGNGLTLQAIGDITANQPVSDAGPAPLTLTYNASGAGGMLSFGKNGHISFLGTGNPLNINSKNYLLAANIATLAQLIARNPAGNFALAHNYDAKPDGRYAQSPISTKFQGNFDGLGNTISNLHVESAGRAGFFQRTSATASIGNIAVHAATYQGRIDVGGLAAFNGGTISGASFTGTVSLTGGNNNDRGWIGGLVGENGGLITFSHSAGKVSSTNLGLSYIGGLVGYDSGAVSYSYSSSSVSVTDGDALAGGLVGWGDADNIQQTYATGSVTDTSTGQTTSSRVGGLVGINYQGSVSSSSASGSVMSVKSYTPVGGLVGYNFYLGKHPVLIDGSVATGSVTGGDHCHCGGAVGNDDPAAPISNTFSYGKVTGGVGSDIGGFVGHDYSYSNGGNALYNDGWCLNSSGITNPSQGAGNLPDDPHIAPFSC